MLAFKTIYFQRTKSEESVELKLIFPQNTILLSNNCNSLLIIS